MVHVHWNCRGDLVLRNEWMNEWLKWRLLCLSYQESFTQNIQHYFYFLKVHCIPFWIVLKSEIQNISIQLRRINLTVNLQRIITRMDLDDNLSNLIFAFSKYLHGNELEASSLPVKLQSGFSHCKDACLFLLSAIGRRNIYYVLVFYWIYAALWHDKAHAKIHTLWSCGPLRPVWTYTVSPLSSIPLPPTLLSLSFLSLPVPCC